MIPRVVPRLPLLMVLGDELRKARVAQGDHRSTRTEGLEGDMAKIERPVAGSDLEGYVRTIPQASRGTIDRPSPGYVDRHTAISRGRRVA
jgi:hypothetical protein